MDHLVQHIESLIFTSQSPITVGEIRNCLKDSFDTKFKKGPIEKALASLKEKYQEEHFSFELVEIAGGFQFLTKTSYHNTIGTYLKQKTKKRLSKAALETLSIIAYKQPVVKSEMEKIRGVSCDSAVQKLLEKELVSIVGRGDGPGKPLQYGTSAKFMDYFGLKNIEDLPQPKDFREPDNEIGEKAPIDEDTIERDHSTSDPAALRAKVEANLNKAAAEQKKRANEALMTDISVAVAISGIIVDGGDLANAVLLPPVIEENLDNTETATPEIEQNNISEEIVNKFIQSTPSDNNTDGIQISEDILEDDNQEETINKFIPTVPLNPSDNTDGVNTSEDILEDDNQEETINKFIPPAPVNPSTHTDDIDHIDEEQPEDNSQEHTAQEATVTDEIIEEENFSTKENSNDPNPTIDKKKKT